MREKKKKQFVKEKLLGTNPCADIFGGDVGNEWKKVRETTQEKEKYYIFNLDRSNYSIVFRYRQNHPNSARLHMVRKHDQAFVSV